MTAVETASTMLVVVVVVIDCNSVTDMPVDRLFYCTVASWLAEDDVMVQLQSQEK